MFSKWTDQYPGRCYFPPSIVKALEENHPDRALEITFTYLKSLKGIGSARATALLGNDVYHDKKYRRSAVQERMQIWHNNVDLILDDPERFWRLRSHPANSFRGSDNAEFEKALLSLDGPIVTWTRPALYAFRMEVMEWQDSV